MGEVCLAKMVKPRVWEEVSLVRRAVVVVFLVKSQTLASLVKHLLEVVDLVPSRQLLQLVSEASKII